MKARKSTAWMTLAALLLVPGRAFSYPPTSVASSFRFSRNDSLASVPFDAADSLIYVQASVNGSAPLWTILDTGSSFTIVDEAVVRHLGLTLAGDGMVYGPGEGPAPRLEFANHVGVQFAGAELRNRRIAALPLDWFSRQEGRSTDGFLGADVFDRFVVEVDYANHELRLYEPANFSYSGLGQRVPIELAPYNVPRAHAEVIAPDGTVIGGTFLIDTGSASALWLTKSFTDAHPELLAAETVEAPSVVAVGGEIKARVGLVGAIQLGDFAVQQPVTRFSQNTSGLFANSGLAGAIGGQTLCHFTVIFDYSRRQMILEPNAHFGDSWK